MYSLFQLLDELSGSGVQSNPKTPKLAPIAKKIFNQFGREVTDVFTLEQNSEIWVSFGEAYISPFSKLFTHMFELHCEKTCLWGFQPGLTDTQKRAVHPQKMARGLKIGI